MTAAEPGKRLIMPTQQGRRPSRNTNSGLPGRTDTPHGQFGIDAPAMENQDGMLDPSGKLFCKMISL